MDRTLIQEILEVVEQAAFVAVLISTVATLVGYQVSRFLMFPLLFLFLMVDHYFMALTGNP